LVDGLFDLYLLKDELSDAWDFGRIDWIDGCMD
jgi:hypothetical protein